MSERKTIRIIPELFSISANKTRKKRDKIADPSKPIKIRSPRKESSNAIKKRLLKYIRQHQDAKDNHRVNPVPVSSTDTEFENDFESSLKYLSSIAEKTQNAVPASAIMRHNHTLRQTPVIPIQSVFENTLNDVSVDLPPALEAPITIRSKLEIPKYGCLKNGTLPTYRMWKSQTQKAPLVPTPVSSAYAPNIQIVGGSVGGSGSSSSNTLLPSVVPKEKVFDSTPHIRASIAKHREIQKQRGRFKPAKKQKQKRILRRTYRVGKSKHYPRVSVLVSNKTLRNQTSTKMQLLKQTPIEEVKRTLIKKGLIKAGSTAPTDVLRKMYESVALVCGDIQNHNPENLLYNYFHANE
jgi:hypothetical protein